MVHFYLDYETRGESVYIFDLIFSLFEYEIFTICAYECIVLHLETDITARHTINKIVTNRIAVMLHLYLFATHNSFYYTYEQPIIKLTIDF